MFKVIAVVIALALGSCAEPEGQNAGTDKAVWLPNHDPAMDAATAQARASLPTFWAIVSNNPAIEERSVKVGYPTRHGGIEYLWVDVMDRHGQQISGRILNEPEDVVDVRVGQAVTVQERDVVDWSYRKTGGRYFGQFTTREVLRHTDKATSQEEGARLSRTPLETATN